jgi:ABC-type amino acid transport system permease subunit
MRISTSKVLKGIARVYVSIIRGTPMIIIKPKINVTIVIGIEYFNKPSNIGPNACPAASNVRISTSKVLKGIARVYVSIIRGTPMIVQLFIIFYGR